MPPQYMCASDAKTCRAKHPPKALDASSQASFCDSFEKVKVSGGGLGVHNPKPKAQGSSSVFRDQTTLRRKSPGKTPEEPSEAFPIVRPRASSYWMEPPKAAIRLCPLFVLSFNVSSGDQQEKIISQAVSQWEPSKNSGNFHQFNCLAG